MIGFRALSVATIFVAWSLPASGEIVSDAPSALAAASIPALTPVSIEILAPLGSKTSKTGENFPIRLAAPIVIGGEEILPAGAAGMGEVIHAKKSGGMGAAGELVLAARYLEIDGRRLTLRSFNLAVTGKSHIGAVDGMAIASAASPIPFGLVGFFISGGQVIVPKGTVAQAETRESFTVPAPAGATPAAATAAAPSTGG